jgi:hypothetical protein
VQAIASTLCRNGGVVFSPGNHWASRQISAFCGPADKVKGAYEAN